MNKLTVEQLEYLIVMNEERMSRLDHGTMEYRLAESLDGTLREMRLQAMQ